ncbi:hypothetical protein AMS68_006462 [Peltaster fructicola]|uniref:Palmitoyltransferase n=1 Tax=Peltaster fructicola TaxID=286661 RepID=A0A6H0Y206_9PEZI|nr:hypothetical protein AMS68_006462 [Peltaster fructicola]
MSTTDARHEAGRKSGSSRSSSNNNNNNNNDDGLDKVELSDLDSSPPRLAVEDDLMQLARLGELRSIQRLFDTGKYTARSTDDQGITALHWAAINGHYALCHFLLHSGADVNARGGDAEATPVLWASKRGNLNIIQLLLSNGADPLVRDDQGYNLLHSATLDGNLFLLTLLLHQAEIPVDVADASGHTSLMWAAYKGFTALHWALVKGNYACIQKLVEHGSDRNVRSKPGEGQAEGDTPAMTAVKMKSERQWKKALLDSGLDENGDPMTFPIPCVKDRRWFYQRFFFLWPFVLGGLQLHMLAYMLVWLALPGVFIVGYGLQTLVQGLFRWAPHDMKSMHRVPVLAGIFSGSLFWVGVQYFFYILPWTFSIHPVSNIAFIALYSFSTYFYAITMTADPGFIPKSSSRGQTKKVIQELVEHNAFDEKHFCTTCLIRKPLRSKHCKRCGRCIAREDHHCPWVDNCVGVNNHKHFVLYLLFLIGGIITLISLDIKYIEIRPEPKELNCALLGPELCTLWSKDALTNVTTVWAALQLIWTVMLLAAHFVQIARALTTYESMRANRDAGPLLTAVATGTTSMEEANVAPEGSKPHRHKHAHKKTTGCLGSWAKLFGLDTFFTIAFNGYHGAKSKDGHDQRARRPPNPFYRGVLRNCEDFWLDGPFFGSRPSGSALVGGEKVNYTSLYDIPKGGKGYAGYEAVPSSEAVEV